MQEEEENYNNLQDSQQKVDQRMVVLDLVRWKETVLYHMDAQHF